MLKPLLLICIPGMLAACDDTPTQSQVSIANGITKIETPEYIAYQKDDARCEVNKASGIYTYETSGTPPSSQQTYFTRRFNALKTQFERNQN